MTHPPLPQGSDTLGADSAASPRGERDRTVEITWLGQAGFLVAVGGRRVLIDPWVSSHEGRLIPSPSLEMVADAIDAVLVTHEHLDHLDLGFLPTLVERSPDVRLVLPSAITDQVSHIAPPDQVIGVVPGARVSLVDIDLDVVSAHHGVTMENAYGDGTASGGLPRFVGYVIHTDAGAVYHAGDTIYHAGLVEALAGADIKLALLPINGRDAFREEAGLVGNLNACEAVELARRIGARVVVPYHWDGFAGNTARPGEVSDAAATDSTVHVLHLARMQSFRFA
jgi:L-ascorbate 6-phosphate lactonase